MTTPIPFQNIAISLSGGGYRATTFHLGALSLLDQLPFQGEALLKHVKVVSTISGGTLTGVMYALQLAEGGTFNDCYGKIYELLTKDELVEQALHKLNYPHRWKNTHKTRDVINAFAEVYNEHFYGGATFEQLFNTQSTHLTDVIFGASEFSSGLQFRFQEDHDQGLFGNGNYSIPIEAAKKIRLADAAASSSCFPGGFEPMIMPNDYGNGPNSEVERAWREKGYPTTGIMDGGVLDNQGIEGVKLAENRHERNNQEPFIGTYIISDVDGKTMKPYVVPKFEYSAFKNFFTLRRINWLVALLMLAGIGGIIWTGEAFWTSVLAASVLTLGACWFAFFFFVRSFIARQIGHTFAGEDLPEILQDFRVITKTPIYMLAYLIDFRATSVLKMVMDLFLRRIRSLQLTSLFSSAEWRGRIKTNNIYALKDKPLSLTGEKMKEVVDYANGMPTTLWFSPSEQRDNKMLNALIACGQFTLCYNLQQYIEDIQQKEFNGENIWANTPVAQKDAIIELKSVLADYWKKFQEDPYWMV